MYKIYAVILMILAPIVSADSFTVEATGGRFYLSVDSVDLGGYNNQFYKAMAAATNKGLECGCPVKIKMPDVTVTVTRISDQPPSYSAKLQWQIPTTREDSNLMLPSEISGYAASYEKLNVEPIIELTGSAETSHTITGLAPGDWSFKLATIDIYGVQSDWSEPFQVIIRGDI